MSQRPRPSAISKAPLASFDGISQVHSEFVEPQSAAELRDTLSSLTAVIPRGAGLSYCAASMGHGACSVSTRKLSGIAIDADTGIADVEPGATLGALLDAAIAKGWYPPVLPGHPSITVGGCIGFNVHGKSQFHTGNFESCIRRIWVYHPAHGETECARDSNADLWRLTVGGFGLSGIVTRAELQLTPLRGRSIEVRKITTRNLVEAVEQMQDLEREHDIIYSWNNLNLKGSAFGEGFIYAERFSSSESVDVERFNTLRPPERPLDRLGLLNRLTTPVMCGIYAAKERLSGETRIVGLHSGSFPINGKEIYFRLFGRSGFLEYQVIVPRERWNVFCASLEKLIDDTRAPISLGSLKIFDGRSHYLNFCMPGVCLALDTPFSPRALRLFRGLDELTIACGGMVNIAKDSRLSAETVEKVFPAYEEYRAALGKLDGSEPRFDSALRRRLAL